MLVAAARLWELPRRRFHLVTCTSSDISRVHRNHQTKTLLQCQLIVRQYFSTGRHYTWEVAGVDWRRDAVVREARQVVRALRPGAARLARHARQAGLLAHLGSAVNLAVVELFENVQT